MKNNNGFNWKSIVITYFPVLLASIAIFVPVLINHISNINIQRYTRVFMIPFILICMGTIAIIIIVRKEMPRTPFSSIRGRCAVIIGYIYLLFIISLAVLYIVGLIFNV